MPSTGPAIPKLASATQLERAESLLATAYRSGITDPKELANFMGQTQHESLNFNRLEENLNYRGAILWDAFKGNAKTPPRNGLTEKEAHELASIPDRSQKHQAIAEKIYGGPWGEASLGNTEARDGYTYRGRGYIQLTGRNNYERQGDLAGLDLIKNPDLASIQNNAEKLAVSYWQDTVQLRPGASTDVTKAGSIINTGAIGGAVKGLDDRQANATAWEAALGKAGYLEGVLERHPAAQTAPAPNEQQGAINQPLSLRAELQLSPQSLQLIQDSEQQVRQIAGRHQLPWDTGLNNTVHAVASAARQNGLTGITHLNAVDGQIRFAQFDGLTLKDGSLNAHTAANTDAQQSINQMAQADQRGMAPQAPALQGHQAALHNEALLAQQRSAAPALAL